MKTRICKVCKLEQVLTNFFITDTIKGVVYRKHVCKNCINTYRRGKQRDMRKWVVSLKKIGKCSNCGIKDHRVLDYHHKFGKSYNIADGANRCYSKEDILNEISKCELVCANCHRMRTHKRH